MPTADCAPSVGLRVCSASKVNVASPKSRISQDPVRIDQQVRRLDVAVYEAGGMGMGQSFGRLADEIGRLAAVQRTLLLDHPSQVRAFDVLHHQVVNLFSIAHVLVEVVGPDDVRMIQRRHGPGFQQETTQQVGIFLVLAGQNLDRRAAVHHLVLGQEHLAHAPLAQGAEDAIGTESETAMFVLQQHVRLPGGQDFPLDQLLGQLLRTLRPRAFAKELGRQRQQLGVGHQIALAEEV